MDKNSLVINMCKYIRNHLCQHQQAESGQSGYATTTQVIVQIRFADVDVVNDFECAFIDFKSIRTQKYL